MTLQFWNAGSAGQDGKSDKVIETACPFSSRHRNAQVRVNAVLEDKRMVTLLLLVIA